MLVRIPGVGKKTAERMVLELRDKLDDSRRWARRCRRARRRRSSALEQDVLSRPGQPGLRAARRRSRRAQGQGARGPPRISSRSSAARWSWYGNLIGYPCAKRESSRRRRRTTSGQFEASLRPQRLADFTGQAKLKENLAIAIEAARQRGEAMDHVLLYGPPGLGKTTLANIIANELEVGFEQTSGPILQKKLDLTGILSNIRARQVFFIDEIHRLMPDVEEMLYSALEDFRVDILIGAGPGARTHSLPHAAVHGHRRHHAAGPGERAAARPLRAGAAAEPL